MSCCDVIIVLTKSSTYLKTHFSWNVGLNICNPLQKREMFSCDVCSSEFASIIGLNNHRYRKHKLMKGEKQIQAHEETPVDIVQPVAVQPVVSQPVAVQPVVSQPVAVQPVAVQPVTVQPVVSQPVVSQAVVSQAVVSQPPVIEESVQVQMLRDANRLLKQECERLSHQREQQSDVNGKLHEVQAHCARLEDELKQSKEHEELSNRKMKMLVGYYQSMQSKIQTLHEEVDALRDLIDACRF